MKTIFLLRFFYSFQLIEFSWQVCREQEERVPMDS